MYSGKIGTLWSNGDFDIVRDDGAGSVRCFTDIVEVDFSPRSGMAVAFALDTDSTSVVARVEAVNIMSTGRNGLQQVA
jgi:hypothetical protein